MPNKKQDIEVRVLVIDAEPSKEEVMEFNANNKGSVQIEIADTDPLLDTVNPSASTRQAYKGATYPNHPHGKEMAEILESVKQEKGKYNTKVRFIILPALEKTNKSIERVEEAVLNQAIQKYKPSLIQASFGTSPADKRKFKQGSEGFEEMLDRVSRKNDILVIKAAGNAGVQRTFTPQSPYIINAESTNYAFNINNESALGIVKEDEVGYTRKLFKQGKLSSTHRGTSAVVPIISGLLLNVVANSSARDLSNDNLKPIFAGFAASVSAEYDRDKNRKYLFGQTEALQRDFQKYLDNYVKLTMGANKKVRTPNIFKRNSALIDPNIRIADE